MKPQIFVKCGNSWFEFSKSKTGQIDYTGKWENMELPAVADYQELSASSYFSPWYYIYLKDSENYNAKIYVAPGVDISEPDIMSYLVHVGALLAAVEVKDSILAGELYLRRRAVFDKYAQLTAFIMEDICVEVLFALCFGRMKTVIADEIPVIYKNARKKLGYDPSKESLEQAFIRWFEKNTVTVTLPLVGEQYHGWDKNPDVLEKLTDNLFCEDLIGRAEKIRKIKKDLYEGLECSVQAEPYNHCDVNSILVSFENIEAKIEGNPGLEKAGHLRALAAAVIRQAKPEKLSYSGKLVRLSYEQTVVQLTV